MENKHEQYCWKIEWIWIFNMIGRMNRAMRFTPNFFKKKIRGARFYPLRKDSIHSENPFINVYKHLKNGCLKIIRVIASGKGTLGISLKIRHTKRK